MTKSFKYTTKEKYQDFLLNNANHNDELGIDPLDAIYSQPDIMALATKRILPNKWDLDKALPTVEVLLHFFCDYEEYETCQSVINIWPELIREENKK